MLMLAVSLARLSDAVYYGFNDFFLAYVDCCSLFAQFHENTSIISCLQVSEGKHWLLTFIPLQTTELAKSTNKSPHIYLETMKCKKKKIKNGRNGVTIRVSLVDIIMLKVLMSVLDFLHELYLHPTVTNWTRIPLVSLWQRYTNYLVWWGQTDSGKCADISLIWQARRHERRWRDLHQSRHLLSLLAFLVAPSLPEEGEKVIVSFHVLCLRLASVRMTDDPPWRQGPHQVLLGPQKPAIITKDTRWIQHRTDKGSHWGETKAWILTLQSKEQHCKKRREMWKQEEAGKQHWMSTK